MGAGPDGSGVTIRKPGQGGSRETAAERQLRERVERRQRLDEHAARERAFQETAKMDVRPYANKRIRPAAGSVPPAPEGTPEDYAALSDAALVALAEEQGLTLTRADGALTREDYLRALGVRP